MLLNLHGVRERGDGNRQQHIPEQEGLIFWDLILLSLSHPSFFLPFSLWEHRAVVPLWNAEKMLSVCGKPFMPQHCWCLAKFTE